MTELAFRQRFTHGLIGLRTDDFDHCNLNLAVPDRHRGDATSIVGRECERQALHTLWSSAKAGQGQVALITGEPGIGKSCLVRALKTDLADEPHHLIEYACSPHHQHSAFYSVIEFIKRTLNFQPGEPVADKLDKLELALSPYPLTHDTAVPLLASLLGLPLFETRYAPPVSTPLRQKHDTLELLIQLIVHLTQHLPVLVVVEDGHWVDPSTLEFLTQLIAQASHLPLLVCLTYRPEFRVPWEAMAHLNQLTLERLSNEHIEQLLGRLTDGKSLPEHVRHHLLAKTDGVPLFIEELTKAWIESDERDSSSNELAGAEVVPPFNIPITIKDSLLARLDRMGMAKAVAQFAATLGRSFSGILLQTVSHFDPDELQPALKRLLEADLLNQRHNSSDTAYLFKHALIQEAIYESMPLETRQQYHEQIALTLVAHVPDMVETQPELVAHHFTEAARPRDAISYWYQAGARAKARSACVEAIAHLNQGLALRKTLPDSPEAILQELELQTMLAPTLMVTTSPTAPEVERVHARARELCQQVGTTPKLLWALEGLWAYDLVRGRLSAAYELGEQLLTLAHQLQSPISFAVAHQTLGLALFYLGEFGTALAHLEEGSAHYVLQPPRAQELRGVHDHGVMCHAFTALASCLLGYPDQALLRVETMIELAEESLHPIVWRLPSVPLRSCTSAGKKQMKRNNTQTSRCSSRRTKAFPCGMRWGRS